MHKCVCVRVLSMCLCLRSVVACVCHSTQHVAARCTLVNVMLLHTHTHICMQTCCGFCVHVHMCVCVADMKYLFAALLAFRFFDIRFFCHFCFRSLTQSPHLPLSLSLSHSPLFQHGVLITLSWSLQLTDSNLCAAVITLSGSGTARQDSNKLVRRRRHSVPCPLSPPSLSAPYRGSQNNHVLYTNIYMLYSSSCSSALVLKFCI